VERTACGYGRETNGMSYVSKGAALSAAVSEEKRIQLMQTKGALADYKRPV